MAQTFEDAGKLGKEFFDGSLKGFAVWSKAAQAIAVETTDYTKKSVEAGTSAFEKLLNAKSLEKAIEIQTEYAKSSYEGFVAQATKMSEMYADLAKDVYAPFESLYGKIK